MVESTSKAWELESLETIPELKTPSLCEIWTWQGDTSVLPYKFESILNSASTKGEEEFYKHNELKEKYIKDARFNPDGFYFLTYRSQAIGLTLAMPKADDPTTYEIPYLVSTTSHRNKGVEAALLSLILTFCKKAGAKKVIVDAPSEDL